MDKVAELSDQQRAELFSETAAKRGMTPAIVEKDFWVTWLLGRLFLHPKLSRLLIFKGGTSLSKAYQLIERFSEDIDLILDWRQLSTEDPLAARSKTKQALLNAAIKEQAQIYIGGELLAQITQLVDDACQCDLDETDPYVINVRYPAAFVDSYLRPEIRLEIGPLASWLPSEERTISCYAATKPRPWVRVKISMTPIRLFIACCVMG